MPENLEKYRSTEFYDAPLEGSTIFLYRSSTRHTSLVSSGLAELKYAFFSRRGCNTKKLSPKEEGSQKNMNGKIPEGQVYAPRLEPMAPIRLADRNHAHYPSRHCAILKNTAQ